MMDGYRTILASEGGDRDGMLVELQSDSPPAQIAEVFEDDDTQVRTFRSYTLEPIPLEAVEHLVEEARRRL